MPIVAGFRYVQPDDPGAVGAGFEWLNDVTGDWYIRNSADTDWVLVGNTNLQYVGHVPVTGTTMTGPLSGATGMATLNSPDFHNAAKRDGYELARMADLAAMRAEILSTISGKVNGVLSQASNSGNRNRVLFKAGLTAALNWGDIATTGFNLGAILENYTYQDGTPAKTSELQGYGIAIVGLGMHDNVVAAADRYFVMNETSTGSKLFKVDAHNNGVNAANQYFRLQWFAFWAR